MQPANVRVVPITPTIQDTFASLYKIERSHELPCQANDQIGLAVPTRSTAMQCTVPPLPSRALGHQRSLELPLVWLFILPGPCRSVGRRHHNAAHGLSDHGHNSRHAV
jgi:hypothetical protein